MKTLMLFALAFSTATKATDWAEDVVQLGNEFVVATKLKRDGALFRVRSFDMSLNPVTFKLINKGQPFFSWPRPAIRLGAFADQSFFAGTASGMFHGFLPPDLSRGWWLENGRKVIDITSIDQNRAASIVHDGRNYLVLVNTPTCCLQRSTVVSGFDPQSISYRAGLVTIVGTRENVGVFSIVTETYELSGGSRPSLVLKNSRSDEFGTADFVAIESLVILDETSSRLAAFGTASLTDGEKPFRFDIEPSSATIRYFQDQTGAAVSGQALSFAKSGDSVMFTLNSTPMQSGCQSETVVINTNHARQIDLAGGNDSSCARRVINVDGNFLVIGNTLNGKLTTTVLDRDGVILQRRVH